MSIRLLVLKGLNFGKSYALAPGKILLIGRGDDCDVQLADASVSRHHCQITVKAGRAVLEDLDSTWGTVVNGEKVSTRLLKPNDIIILGQTQLKFDVSVDAHAVTWEHPVSEVPAAKVTPPVQKPPSDEKRPKRAKRPERQRSSVGSARSDNAKKEKIPEATLLGTRPPVTRRSRNRTVAPRREPSRKPRPKERPIRKTPRRSSPGYEASYTGWILPTMAGVTVVIALLIVLSIAGFFSNENEEASKPGGKQTLADAGKTRAPSPDPAVPQTPPRTDPAPSKAPEQTPAKTNAKPKAVPVSKVAQEAKAVPEAKTAPEPKNSLPALPPPAKPIKTPPATVPRAVVKKPLPPGAPVKLADLVPQRPGTGPLISSNGPVPTIIEFPKVAGWCLTPDNVTLVLSIPSQAQFIFVDTVAGKESRRLDLDFKPGPIALQGDLIYAAGEGTTLVYAVDFQTGTIKQEYKLPAEPARAIACHNKQGADLSHGHIRKCHRD